MDKLIDIKKKNVSKHAIEVMAKNMHMTYEQVADTVGVSRNTICKWMSNADFIDKVYKRYMEIAGSELPAVVQAMIEESKLGNVHAAKLILQHFGKFEHKITHVHESNFEKFMKKTESIDVEDADFFEVNDDDVEILDVIAEHVGDKNIELPERHVSNDTPKLRDDYERARLNGRVTTKTKEIDEKGKQAQRYLIRKRAKAVDLELLGPGRHSKSERDAWMKKLERLEKQKK